MPPAFTPWSEEKVEELKALWAGGFSATEIARRLAIDVTRSGVLGKVMRLKLPQRRSAEFKPGPPSTRAQEPEKRGPLLRRAVFLPPKKKEPPVLEVLPAEPKRPRMRRLQLLQLAEHHCRWPYGDPHRHPFYFCAADRKLGDAYCDYHMRRAFVKPRQR